jgi:hypothetical protein
MGLVGASLMQHPGFRVEAQSNDGLAWLDDLPAAPTPVRMLSFPFRVPVDPLKEFGSHLRSPQLINDYLQVGNAVVLITMSPVAHISHAWATANRATHRGILRLKPSGILFVVATEALKLIILVHHLAVFRRTEAGHIFRSALAILGGVLCVVHTSIVHYSLTGVKYIIPKASMCD